MRLCESTFGQEEKEALLSVIESGFFTMGKKVEKAEKDFAEYTGSKYAVMVNSGSSANLLMVAAYTLKHGPGTVIVPALAWSTSYSPFQQYGWKLKIVDIDPETLNYDLVQLNEAYTGNELILAVNILGNPNDFELFPDAPRLVDNCESMGSWYMGKEAGTYGEMGAYSTFFSHHICTMEGGFVVTDDQEYYEMLLSLRSHGWTRHLPRDNKLGFKPSAYDFIFPGYNVRPIEMAGALAIEQIKKLPEFIENRRINADNFPLKKVKEIGKNSYFAFPIINDRIEKIKTHLTNIGVEWRPLVGGCFTKHEAKKYYDYEIYNTLENAEYVDKFGIYIGNSHKLTNWGFLKVLC